MLPPVPFFRLGISEGGCACFVLLCRAQKERATAARALRGFGSEAQPGIRSKARPRAVIWMPRHWLHMSRRFLETPSIAFVACAGPRESDGFDDPAGPCNPEATRGGPICIYMLS